MGRDDQQKPLPLGTPEQIEEDVRAKMEVRAAVGGVVFQHIIQSDTSVENVEAFIAAVKKHGVYA